MLERTSIWISSILGLKSGSVERAREILKIEE
jgi:hypothetical protein